MHQHRDQKLIFSDGSRQAKRRPNVVDSTGGITLRKTITGSQIRLPGKLSRFLHMRQDQHRPLGEIQLPVAFLKPCRRLESF
ncbi:MAG: hypothetical protein ACK54I_03735 [Planctomycetota bacterium]